MEPFASRAMSWCSKIKVRPDTIGKIEEVDAKYELLPRGEYTWKGPQYPRRRRRKFPCRSMKLYRSCIRRRMRSASPKQPAPKITLRTRLRKREQLIASAQRWQQNKANSDRVVEEAREASQTAEDARMIAEAPPAEDQLVKAGSGESAREPPRNKRSRRPTGAGPATAGPGAGRCGSASPRRAQQAEAVHRAAAEAAAQSNAARHDILRATTKAQKAKSACGCSNK